MGRREEAQKILAKAEEVVREKKFPAALDHGFQLFSSACYADPDYGHAFFSNGNNTHDLGKLHAAVACYRRGLECELTKEEKIKIKTNLAWTLQELGQINEAVTHLHECIELEPKLPLAWMHLGICHSTLGDTETALSCAIKAKELATADHALAEFQLAFALLFAGKYAEGLKAFEARFEHRLPQFLAYPYPEWKGEKDRTVFLVADQGLGDTLSYARFVPQAAKRARFIHAVVQAELLETFRYAFMAYPNINWHPQPMNFPGDADFWTTFVSLPYALGLNDEQIKSAPNFKMLTRNIPPQHWKVPGRKFHIGIAWAGSALNDIDKHRAVPVHHFLELYRVPGIQLYSLQVDARKVEMHQIGAAPVISDLSNFIRDVVDTSSLLQNLDLVITLESAMGHIAGANNKECWIPYSYMGRDFRLGPRGDRILWYKNHRTFQQGPDMRWEPVFDRIVAALQEKVHGNVDEGRVFEQRLVSGL